MKLLPNFLHFTKSPAGIREKKAEAPAPNEMQLHSPATRLEEVDRVARNIFGRISHPESLLVTKKLIGMVSALSEDEKLLLKESVRRMKGGVFFPWLEEFMELNPESRIVRNEKKSCWEISNLDLRRQNAAKTYEITSLAAVKMSRIEKVHRAFWDAEEFSVDRHTILIHVQVVSKRMAGI